MSVKYSSARLTKSEYLEKWESSRKMILHFNISNPEEYLEVKQVLVKHSEGGGISEALDYGEHLSENMNGRGVSLPRYGTKWQFTRWPGQQKGTYGWGVFNVYAIMDELINRGFELEYEFQ